MTSPESLRATLAEVVGAGGCSHPVRLAGTTVDRSTGELSEGRFTVACKDRRAVVCPACARLYQHDAWQLVAAGLRGGKGVPAEVAGHPRLFVTLTAPSFGPVHSRPTGTKPAPCRMGSRSTTCLHGVPRTCGISHAADDPALGQPLCPRCFDYTGAVLWNAHASRLWRRTTVALIRTLAQTRGTTVRLLRREVRLSFVKVAEFQRRGLVHFHAVVRADGPDGPTTPPPVWLDHQALAGAVRSAADRATVPRTGSDVRLGWGRQLDVRLLADAVTGGPTDPGPGAVAAYVAKYATKTSDTSGTLAHPIRSTAEIGRLRLSDHHRRLVETAWRLGGEPDLAPLRLRAHAHTFGFPGHATTKSHRYSTTFGSLRQARKDHTAGNTGSEPVTGGWHYLGRGYRSDRAAALAEALARLQSAHR